MGCLEVDLGEVSQFVVLELWCAIGSMRVQMSCEPIYTFVKRYTERSSRASRCIGASQGVRTSSLPLKSDNAAHIGHTRIRKT